MAGMMRVEFRGRVFILSFGLSLFGFGLSLGASSVLCLSGSSASEAAAQDQFSFSAEAAKDQQKADADAAARAQSIQALTSVPCPRRVKDQKILLLVGEQSSGRWLTSQERYGQLIQVLDTRLKGVGLKPYSEQQIKASIAQAEVQAYFNNDPDGAISASKRLGAGVILKGSITQRAGTNPVVGVKEVDVDINLTLSALDGRVLSDVSAHSGSYSGSDTLDTALQLMKQQADLLVAQLYSDFCKNAK
jgi:hypothetical protein